MGAQAAKGFALTLSLAAVLAALVGCKRGEGDRGRAAGDTAIHSADTVVTERTVRDTAIITHDTIIRSDTIVKRGGVVDSATKRRP
jgi:hypothetical protein